MRLLLIMRLLLFTIGLKLSRGYYNRGGYYPSAVTITGNTVHVFSPDFGHFFAQILGKKVSLSDDIKISKKYLHVGPDDGVVF